MSKKVYFTTLCKEKGKILENKFPTYEKNHVFLFPKSIWEFHFWTFIFSNFEKWKYMLENEKL